MPRSTAVFPGKPAPPCFLDHHVHAIGEDPPHIPRRGCAQRPSTPGRSRSSAGAEKALPGAPHYSWIVIDTTTGQNALNQAEAFGKAVNLNGAILAKLDSSAKGGMVFAIKDQLNLPVIYAGLGEKIEDLELFDKKSFIDSIFSRNEGK